MVLGRSGILGKHFIHSNYSKIFQIFDSDTTVRNTPPPSVVPASRIVLGAEGVGLIRTCDVSCGPSPGNGGNGGGAPNVFRHQEYNRKKMLQTDTYTSEKCQKSVRKNEALKNMFQNQTGMNGVPLPNPSDC